MKTKKWITIGLISLVVLIASVVLLFVLVLPGIKNKNAMKALEEGDKVKAGDLFMGMTSDKADGYKDDVKDLIVYKANQCLKNEITYDEFFKVMSTIEEIYAFNGMTVDAMKAVNGPRMKKLYEDGVAEYAKNGDSSTFTSLGDEFRALKYISWNEEYIIWDDTVEDAYNAAVIDPLESELSAKYDAYNAGTVDYDEMKAYVDTASSFWFSEKAFDLSSELYYDKYFKEELEKAKEDYDKEDYWACIRDIDNTRDWYGGQDSFSKWKSQFDTLYEEAENKAKTYYVDKAIQAAQDGDEYEVNQIIEELKSHFGADFDTSAIEQNLHADWQKAYVAYFAGDWKGAIKNELSQIGEDEDVFNLRTLDPDKDLPTKMFLMDLDNDKVPEVILADSKYMFIYTYHGSYVELAGILQWKGMGDDGKIVSAGNMVYQEIDISLMLLTEFRDGSLEYLKMAAIGMKDGKTVYGIAENGSSLEETDEETYNAAVEAINAEAKTTSLTGGANISDYEKYIYSYKAE